MDTDANDLVKSLGLDRLPYYQQELTVRDLVDLSGVRAAVTGGGGRNLGKAIVDRLAGLGADVAVIDVDGGLAAEAADNAVTKWNAKATPVVADLTTWTGAESAVEESAHVLGGIDVWVNSVGGRAGIFLDMTPADIEATVALNLMTNLMCTKAILPRMVAAGAGRIINISSESSKMGAVGLSVYAACKAAIDCFTRNLAHEVGPHGVGVVCVNPGMMLGEAGQQILQEPERFPEKVAATRQVAGRITAGRPCLPEEVANMVAFLASRAGSYVQGTTVSVGGGMSS